MGPSEDPATTGTEGAVEVEGGEGPRASADDLAFAERLRARDEAAYAQLVRQYHSRLTRLAVSLVGNQAVAQEVVQATWLGVVEGIERFAGRSALKTWIFRILVNQAVVRARKERRSIPFSALGPGLEGDEPAVDPERFNAAGGWAEPPKPWREDSAEAILLRAEALGVIERTLAELPPSQRTVVILRDIEGLDAAEVCNALGLSATNQRVLLHRGRSKLQRAVERVLGAR